MSSQKLQRCEELSKSDIPIKELLKEVAELFPLKKNLCMGDYFVVTAAELLDKLNEGSNVSFKRGREGTPSYDFPYYWVNVDGGPYYSMYSMYDSRTAKYGICWDSCV